MIRAEPWEVAMSFPSFRFQFPHVRRRASPPDTNQSEQRLGAMGFPTSYMKWMDAHHPFRRHSLGRTALHASEVRVLGSEPSLEALFSVWSPNLDLQNSFNSVTTCGCLRCGHVICTELQDPSFFFRTSISFKVNAAPHNARISRDR